MPTTSELLNELNRDIWHPFRAAYAARDTASFLLLHMPDLIRAGGPTREALDFDGYAVQITDWFATQTANGDRATIDFRFTERIVSRDVASERGVYEITASRPGHPDKVLYGRFHTFARRAAGHWHIAVDYDSNDGGTVDAQAFRSAAAIDDTEAF